METGEEPQVCDSHGTVGNVPRVPYSRRGSVTQCFRPLMPFNLVWKRDSATSWARGLGQVTLSFCTSFLLFKIAIATVP